ncbi:hypothetical protein FQN54_006961 [Arachnomyces sp. PD_36]|nr:hypothetical protein FQN54_006961 [Arachnomyces sp. PD_36]
MVIETSTHRQQKPKPVGKHEPIVIIGAGAFGLSTALELKSRGYEDVTVLDRHSPPVPDGSSVDVSRIIRPDYADPLYSRMAVECMKRWETDYSQFFYRTGFALLSSGKDGHPYLDQCKRVLDSQGVKWSDFSNARELKEKYPAITGDLGELTGYLNPTSGWADPAGAIQEAANRCSAAGVSFMTGDRGTVTGFVRSGREVIGVKLRSGGILHAARFILATGAWTTRLIDMDNSAHSTAQPVGFIQLTPEEAKSIADIPVCINLSTGFFVFPPTPGNNLLKIARHGFGYETDVKVQRSQDDNGRETVVSAPNIRTAGAVKPGFFIPEDAEKELRRGLENFFPQFKDHPWYNQRLCWYTDTSTGDFIIDHYPHMDHVFVATGGSGHGFKFLPTLGKYIVDCFEGSASQELRQRWAWRPSKLRGKGDGSRGGPDGRKLTPGEQARL